MTETLICVVEDVGIRVWLERVLDEGWLLEFVSASDLSRVTRLAGASKARVAVVAVDEENPEKSARRFDALNKANPALRLVAVARYVSQDLLLNIMRAGARDCLLTTGDADWTRQRLHALSRPDQASTGTAAGQKMRNITLVTGAASVVDTRFFTQNLASELNGYLPGASILAVDTAAPEGHAFYLDTLNRLTLNDLVRRSDAIDESFVSAALDEFAPGLRLLSGRILPENLEGDASADLFIAVSRLRELFSHLIIRVAGYQAESWLKILGSDVNRLFILAHPVVEHVRQAESFLQQSRRWLASDSETHVVIDGYEKRANLSLAEIGKSMGQDVSLRLPVEWLQRLDSINAGVPLSALPRRSRYRNQLKSFVGEQYAEGRRSSFLNRKARQAGG